MILNKAFVNGLGVLAVVLLPGLLMTGCGSNGAQDQMTAAQNQERERLQTENQDLAQVRSDNEEVQKFKKENQELSKLRSQYQEAARLRKENEQLRQQIAKISPPGATNQPGGAAGGQGTPLSQQEKDKPKDTAIGGVPINDGDEIMIDPKFMKQLLPDFEWEKLGRKEPLAVRSLLEKDGVQLTNTLQLADYGITNYVIRKAPAVPAVPPPETR